MQVQQRQGCGWYVDRGRGRRAGIGAEAKAQGQRNRGKKIGDGAGARGYGRRDKNMDRAKGQWVEQRDKRMDKGVEAETFGLRLRDRNKGTRREQDQGLRCQSGE